MKGSSPIAVLFAKVLSALESTCRFRKLDNHHYLFKPIDGGGEVFIIIYSNFRPSRPV